MNSCIFKMHTVVIANARMWAWQKSVLIAITSNIIQKDWSTSLTKAGKRAGLSTWCKWWICSHNIPKITCGQLCNFIIPVVGYPSCLQTTWASLLSQESSQTVPHCPPEHTSTLPALELAFIPWTSLISPLLQTPNMGTKLKLIYNTLLITLMHV